MEKKIAPAREMNIKPGTAEGLVKVIREATTNSGKQRLLKQAVRLTELPNDKMVQFTEKMSVKDRRNMINAISELSRVVQAVKQAGI